MPKEILSSDSTRMTSRTLLMLLFPLAALAAAPGGASAQTTWHVDDDNCPGPGSGTEADPFCSIQDGIVAAVGGDEVLVEPGTYNELIDFLGKAITLHSSGGPEVTTLDGTGQNDSVVTCASGEGLGTVLEGFTVTGGNATNGGGMFMNNTSPTVNDCVFSGNSALGGGGANINGGMPTLTGCEFSQNSAINGGGLMIEGGSLTTFISCSFTGNDATEGGGMFINRSSPGLTNCTFSGNVAAGTGGPTGFGGGVRSSLSNPVFTNCTFSQNTARFGGGTANETFSIVGISNCIFWQNQASISGNQVFNAGAVTTIRYSDVQGSLSGGAWDTSLGTDAGGNIDADPLFVDAANADLRLLPGSPCIDSGNNALVTSATDLDGNPRIVDGDGDTIAVVDMGAYESAITNQPPTCNTGGPYTAECEAGSTSLQLDGSGSNDSDDDPLGFEWTTDCPGGFFDDPASPTPILTVDTSGGCDNACEVTLTVDDGNGGSSECSTSVTISDTQPPVVTCSATPLNGHRMVIEYDASDDCGEVTGSAVIETACCPLPVADGQIIAMRCKQRQECKILLDFKRDMFLIQSDVATLVVTATDECGNEATCTVELCILDVDDVDDSDSDSDSGDDSDRDSDSDDD